MKLFTISRTVCLELISQVSILHSKIWFCLLPIYFFPPLKPPLNIFKWHHTSHSVNNSLMLLLFFLKILRITIPPKQYLSEVSLYVCFSIGKIFVGLKVMSFSLFFRDCVFQDSRVNLVNESYRIMKTCYIKNNEVVFYLSKLTALYV